jgi:hypothetical protein
MKYIFNIWKLVCAVNYVKRRHKNYVTGSIRWFVTIVIT